MRRFGMFGMFFDILGCFEMFWDTPCRFVAQTDSSSLSSSPYLSSSSSSYSSSSSSIILLILLIFMSIKRCDNHKQLTSTAHINNVRPSVVFHCPPSHALAWERRGEFPVCRILKRIQSKIEIRFDSSRYDRVRLSICYQIRCDSGCQFLLVVLD